MTTARTALPLWTALVCLPVASQGARGQESPEGWARAVLSSCGIEGGLVVHVGCTDGRKTAALGAQDGYVVHGLARTGMEVDAARRYLRDRGLYGRVSVDRYSGVSLPYADDLVTVVVGEREDLPAPEEVMRVLAPGGAAVVREEGRWQTRRKPRPEAIDEWTHFLHDAGGNPVSRDRVVGPPRGLHWIAGPRWARHHDHMASMTSLVSAGRRLFYILDEGPTESIQLPSRWRLIARDAFSGVVLWKRPVASWNTRQWPLKSGPAHLTRRLVAIGERVYATLGIDSPVSILDAATGRTLREVPGSERTREVLVSSGVLLIVAGLEPSRLPEWRRRDTYVWANSSRANADWAWDRETRVVAAFDASSGELRWKTERPVAPCSLAADGERVVFHDGDRLVSLSQKDGQPRWESEPVAASLPVHTSTGPRVVLHGDVVLFSGNNGIVVALSLRDGSRLWQGKQPPSGHQSLRDLMVVGGLVWSAPIAGGNDSGVFTGRDPLTGEVKRTFAPDVDTYWFHHRCYPSKATERYVLTSRTGIEFVDPAAEHWETHHWVRGGCIYGVLPANGMVYAPMHSCGCYLESKLNGFNALTPGPVFRPDPASLSSDARLEKGPAYGDSSAGPPSPSDWPTYRHDAHRSGSTPQKVEGDLKLAWSRAIGGRLTSPVVAGGLVLVASRDTHVLHAIDARSGEPSWVYTAGGPIDSPPTVHRGLALFGSADGYVQALRIRDGALAWKFRAAPADRRIVAFDQLESIWPVHGSVLVHEGILYCTAGRSIFLDGGIRFLKLDPLTGEKLAEVVWDELDPETGENMQVHVRALNMPVALSDVLSLGGEHLYMRSQKIDLEGNRLEIPVEAVDQQHDESSHIFCQIGFLDDSWFHRSYWTYGRRVSGGYGGWPLAGRYVPAGRLLVFDDGGVYGYGRKPEYFVNSSVLEHHLFCAERNVSEEAVQQVRSANGRINARSRYNNANSSDWKLRQAFHPEDLTAVRYRWKLDQPALQVRAMVATGSALFVAGHPDFVDERRALRLPDDPEVQEALQRQAEALEGLHGGLLWAVSK
ncbi:MAG: PQQ-binding-like beta-propeller repeat protein, partial [Planctomycetes bacterium]|nr:PQQ-binding-like beta-propeller repeat protein [Planctomycetota bacterium]